MAKLNVDIQHNLSQEEALKRIKNLLPDLQKRFENDISDVSETWTENVGTFSFKAKKFPVSGTLTVTEKEVQLRGEIPLLLVARKKQIEETIQQKGKELLAA